MQLFPVSQGVTLGCDNKGLQPIFPTLGPTIIILKPLFRGLRLSKPRYRGTGCALFISAAPRWRGFAISRYRGTGCALTIFSGITSPVGGLLLFNPVGVG